MDPANHVPTADSGPWGSGFETLDQRRQHRADVIKAAVDYVLQTGLPACRVCTMFDIPQATLYRHLTKVNKQRLGGGVPQAGSQDDVSSGTVCRGEMEPPLSSSQGTHRGMLLQHEDMQAHSRLGTETRGPLEEHSAAGNSGNPVTHEVDQAHGEVKAFQGEQWEAQEDPDSNCSTSSKL